MERVPVKRAGAPGVGWEGWIVAVTLNFTPNHTWLIRFPSILQASLGSREVGTRAGIILSAQHPFVIPLLLPQTGSVRPVMAPELTGSANRQEGWRMD